MLKPEILQIIQSTPLISTTYFSQCEQLQLISQKFPLNDLPTQITSRDLLTQFDLIKALTQTKKHKGRWRDNTIQQNQKNRYKEQSIYEHSRVVLDSEEGNQEGYVNANYVDWRDGVVIVMQAPVEGTVADVEKMIVQNSIECVVMLCNIIEAGKTKCYPYSQNHNQTKLHTNAYLEQTQNTFQETTYNHIFYSEWPDKSTPSEYSHINELIDMMLKFKNIIIHCSAGLGRSGVIAAIFEIVKNIQNGDLEIGIFQVVRKLREIRYGAVQNYQQFAFVYKFLEYRYCLQK